MRINDVKTIILNHLRPFAETNGFKIRKGKFELVSKVLDPVSIISFDYNTWGFEVNIFPYVSVDFKEIWAICELCGFNLNYTAFINLLILREIKTSGWYPDIKPQMQISKTDRLILTDDEEWTGYCNQEIDNLLPYALDYMDKLHDIGSIDKLYNTMPINRYDPNCSDLVCHCVLGTISARLSQNPMYDQIKDTYARIMREVDCYEEDRQAFFKIVDYLE